MKLAIMLVLILLGLSEHATAQGIEIASGYSFLAELDEEKFPLAERSRHYNGWFVTGTVPLVGAARLAINVQGHYDRVSQSSSVSLHSGMAGINVTPFRRGVVSLFAEALAGAVRSGATYRQASDSQTHFAAQGVVGVAVFATAHFGLCGAVSYRRVVPTSNDNVIASLGVAFR